MKSVAKEGHPPALSLSILTIIFFCILISTLSVSDPKLTEVSQKLKPLKPVQHIQRFVKGRGSDATEHTTIPAKILQVICTTMAFL